MYLDRSDANTRELVKQFLATSVWCCRCDHPSTDVEIVEGEDGKLLRAVCEAHRPVKPGKVVQ